VDERDTIIQRKVKLHRRLRVTQRIVLVSFILLVAWRFYRGPADDFSIYDQREFTVARVIDGDTFLLNDNQKTRVTLLGIDAPDLPDHHFAAEAHAYLAGRLKDRSILLKLDGTETRDAKNRLRAYVYITETDLLNADVVRDGRGYADRRTNHVFRPQVEQLETEARKKKRGLWERLTDDRMPAWRREWLASRGL
jgi:endonuclease YncB( thermonuclease family)